ncbi:hypothetical protein [Sporosarcina sp. HYO08]|nr:hypothetical protein [Sporosarcina sp. HYO08]
MRMKGSHLVIGLVLFVLIVVAVIYFTMMATFDKGETGFESFSTIEYKIS